MGGSTQDVLAGAAGFAVGGPTGAAIGVGLSRKSRGKNIIGSDITGPGFQLEGTPDPPDIDSAADLIRRQRLAARIREAAIPGEGRRATVATSPLGIVSPISTTRTVLRGG